MKAMPKMIKHQGQLYVLAGFADLMKKFGFKKEVHKTVNKRGRHANVDYQKEFGDGTAVTVSFNVTFGGSMDEKTFSTANGNKFVDIILAYNKDAVKTYDPKAVSVVKDLMAAIKKEYEVKAMVSKRKLSSADW